MISVTCHFVFKVAFPDGKSKNIEIYATENIENYAGAVDHARQLIEEDLMAYIEGYAAKCEYRGNIGQLWHIVKQSG